MVGKVTAGLAENNDSVPLDVCLCIAYGTNFTFFYCFVILILHNFGAFLGGIAESDSTNPPVATCYHSVVCLSVCLSICMSYVTLVHPAKAVERIEVPFGRDTC